MPVGACSEIFTQALHSRLANVEPSTDRADRRNLGNRELLGKDLRRVLLQWVRPRTPGRAVRCGLRTSDDHHEEFVIAHQRDRWARSRRVIADGLYRASTSPSALIASVCRMTSPVPDPAARAEELGERVDVASARVLATAAGISDEQAREPSSLPGWSRGHVLTHLARNADGLRNLLIWARTGVVTPQYPSFEVRNQEIEAGAGRPRASWLSISPTQRRPLRPRRPGSATATGPRRCAACEAQRIPPGTRSGGGCPNWKSTTSTWTPATGPRTGRLISPVSACRGNRQLLRPRLPRGATARDRRR